MVMDGAKKCCERVWAEVVPTKDGEKSPLSRTAGTSVVSCIYQLERWPGAAAWPGPLRATSCAAQV
jgi:hypothetical protein